MSRLGFSLDALNNIVILSEVETSQSGVSAESKDLVRASTSTGPNGSFYPERLRRAFPDTHHPPL